MEHISENTNKQQSLTQRKRQRKNTEDNPNNTHKHLLEKTPEEIYKEIKEQKSFWNLIENDEKNQNLANFLKKDKKFSFGNYDRYYHKRNINPFEDPRINIMEPEWFKDKDIMDLGCNDGYFSLLVCSNFHPKSIMAIDIDSKLISKAIKNIKYLKRRNLSKDYIENLVKLNKMKENEENIVKQILNDKEEKHEEEEEEMDLKNNFDKEKDEIVGDFKQDNNQIVKIIKEKLYSKNSEEANNIQLISEKLSEMPKSFLINLGHKVDDVRELKELSQKFNSNISNSIDSLQNSSFPIKFDCFNYVSKLINDEPKFDTILCLSITKWIHLNYGDIGIQVLFNNIFNELKENGILILEIHNWKSYKKKKNLNKRTQENFNQIKFKPDSFLKYLEKVYKMKFLGTFIVDSFTKKGFDRPLYVMKKVVESPKNEKDEQIDLNLLENQEKD